MGPPHKAEPRALCQPSPLHPPQVDPAGPRKPVVKSSHYKHRARHLPQVRPALQLHPEPVPLPLSQQHQARRAGAIRSPTPTHQLQSERLPRPALAVAVLANLPAIPVTVLVHRYLWTQRVTIALQS